LAILIEWILKKYALYLTIILRKIDEEDNQITDGGTVYRQILINAKLKTDRRGQTTELPGRSP